MVSTYIHPCLIKPIDMCMYICRPLGTSGWTVQKPGTGQLYNC